MRPLGYFDAMKAGEVARKQALLVTVEGPEHRVDLELPGDQAVGELVPLLLRICAPEQAPMPNRQWQLRRATGEVVPAAQTLAAAGVVEGALLELCEAGPETLPAPAPARAPRPDWEDGLTPRERFRQTLPHRASAPERLSEVARAFVTRGQSSPTVPVTRPAAGQVVRPQVLTRPSRPGHLERIRESWRESGYRYRLERAITGSPLRRSVTIAVVSPKGGVGKTTITVLLGTLLALVRRDRIVAVDTNPDFGSLGRSLVPDHDVYVDDLLGVVEDPQLTATGLDRRLGRTAHNLMVLPAPTDPVRMARLDEVAYTRVVRKLQQLVGVVLLDTGTGLQDPAARAALAASDQVVLVTDPEPATASLVAAAAALLEQEGMPLWLVLNKMRRETPLERATLGDLVPQAQALVEIPEDTAGARRVAAGAFSWLDAPASWQGAVRELAVSLVAAWPPLGLASVP